MTRQFLTLLAFIPSLWAQDVSFYNTTCAPVYIQVSRNDTYHTAAIIKEYKKDILMLNTGDTAAVYSCLIHPVTHQPMFLKKLYDICIPATAQEIILKNDLWKIST